MAKRNVWRQVPSIVRFRADQIAQMGQRLPTDRHVVEATPSVAHRAPEMMQLLDVVDGGPQFLRAARLIFELRLQLFAIRAIKCQELFDQGALGKTSALVHGGSA